MTSSASSSFDVCKASYPRSEELTLRIWLLALGDNIHQMPEMLCTYIPATNRARGGAHSLNRAATEMLVIA